MRASEWPDCQRVPCRCDKPYGKPALGTAERVLLWRYDMSSRLGIPPSSGGLDDQNFLELACFSVIASAEERRDGEVRREAARKMGPLALLMMPQKGR